MNNKNEKETAIDLMDDKETYLYIRKGLLLLGWNTEPRLTNEDKAILLEVCKETYSIRDTGKLSLSTIDDLSLKAYNLLKFQFVNTYERADYISTVYVHSVNMKPLLPLIDEATMSFYRGYYLASLSILFIVLERYLRNVFQWTPEKGDVRFSELRDSILSLPNIEEARIAYKIVKILYDRFDSLNPSQFYFNRHGLLHGLRGYTEYDQMNCARIFSLLNQLCRAENISRTAYGDYLKMFNYRMTVYSLCYANRKELELLSIEY